MPASMMSTHRDTGERFWCINGHPQSFSNNLTKQLATARGEATRANASLAAEIKRAKPLQDELATAKADLAKTKQELAKLQKQVADAAGSTTRKARIKAALVAEPGKDSGILAKELGVSQQAVAAVMAGMAKTAKIKAAQEAAKAPPALPLAEEAPK